MDLDRERRRRILVTAACLLNKYYTSNKDNSSDSDDDFFESQIERLVAFCTNHPGTTSIEEAIRVLKAIPGIYKEKSLYLYSKKLLENPTRREFFMKMPPDRRVNYLRYFYDKRGH